MGPLHAQVTRHLKRMNGVFDSTFLYVRPSTNSKTEDKYTSHIGTHTLLNIEIRTVVTLNMRNEPTCNVTPAICDLFHRFGNTYPPANY